MSLPRLLSLSLCALTLLNLNSCGIGSGRVDIVNPTVAEMDSLDVQWGLTPRKSKGGPRRTFQYVDQGTSTGASAAPEAVTPPARENVNAPPPASINPEPPAAAPQSVPATLR